MKQLTANVFVETGLKGANHGLVTTSDGMAPHVMRLNVANLYDYLTGAGIHGQR